MNDASISFQTGGDDFGADYEAMMGGASRLVGGTFLDWLTPPPGSAWIDVGCGNGAFTRLIVERCAPSRILGVDPSEPLLAYARRTDPVATYRAGDALALPAGDGEFDVAVMALVLFFLDDPALGVAEMTRAVRPGGLVCAYLWDVCEPGGYPYGPLLDEFAASGLPPIMPPSASVSRMDALRSLWTAAGLTEVDTRPITITRSFAGFDDYWTAVEIQLGLARWAGELTPDARDALRRRLQAGFEGGEGGRVSFPVRANAVAGRKPR